MHSVRKMLVIVLASQLPCASKRIFSVLGTGARFCWYDLRPCRRDTHVVETLLSLGHPCRWDALLLGHALATLSVWVPVCMHVVLACAWEDLRSCKRRARTKDDGGPANRKSSQRNLSLRHPHMQCIHTTLHIPTRLCGYTCTATLCAHLHHHIVCTPAKPLRVHTTSTTLCVQYLILFNSVRFGISSSDRCGSTSGFRF